MLRRKMTDTEGKTFGIVWSAEQFQAKVSVIAEERDSLGKKCKELAMEIQWLPGFDEEARSLRARVVKVKEASNKKASKVMTKRGTANLEVIAE